jgi:ATP-dependent exoDNAse (exonuclease V) beta subunit
VQTDQFDLYKPIDEQMGFHEKLRLLYVGCTRARDHLVVSAHRKVRTLNERSTWTHAELLWDAAQGATWEALTPGDETSFVRSEATAEPVRVISPAEWELERAKAFAQGSRRLSVAATALAHRDDGPDVPIDPGLAKQPRDLELPPWNKGRYGTAIGRAVHGVLQTVDLVTGDGLGDAVAAQAAAEGVLGHEPTIAALCRAALDSDSVRRARDLPRWRETYVAVPAEGLTLEGYVDLLYRDDDGLVIVDYKTDALPDDAARANRVAQYQVQTAAYAVAVESATGEPVVRCVLCFLDPAGAREHVIQGQVLADAVAEVRRRVRAEHEDPSPIAPPVLAEA